MKMLFSSTSRAAILLMICALAEAATAYAEPIPLPNVDFQAKATVWGKNNMMLHQSGGKARMELQAAGMPTITGIMDLNAHKMFMIGAIPGMQNMALEIEFGNDTGYGQVMGEGRRVGTATVMGETCDLWEIENTKIGRNRDPITACLAHDNIPLQTEMMIDGKRRTVMEVTEVMRAPQDPSLFNLPANVQVMKLPKGASEMIQALPGMPAKQ
jgi:hypothetical protein